MKGRIYLDKIGAKKENHLFSVKILEKILDKGQNSWYDSTGRNPLYEDRTISYSYEGVSTDKPERDPALDKSSEESGAFSLYYLSKKLKTLKSNLSIVQY